MAALHTALKALAPITFSDLPTEQAALDSWLSDLFSQTQLVLESIPIPAPNESAAGPSTPAFTANKAAEVLPSSARSLPPSAAHQALQQEWGKPVKLGVKEDMMGMSVHKLSGKDGRGSWFARRSVHEGISFEKFKKALQMEFPESTAVQGAPGEGNVRGIGGETKVEDIRTATGKVEVYRLSAQFPGPTTPRDFVTMLISNESTMTEVEPGQPIPRHYLIVSKPCDHPDTQPQSGFIRGYYESVEFIREVPRQASASNRSVVNVNQDGVHNFSRKRSMTPPLTEESDGPLPVEWIMVTRSDPGGSVPRFMVERGTPSSICADANKFLDWACQQEFERPQVPDVPDIRDVASSRYSVESQSRQSFRNSRLVGADEVELPEHAMGDETPRNIADVTKDEDIMDDHRESVGLTGTLVNAAHYLTTQAPQAAYEHTAEIVYDHTPQVLLDHLPEVPGGFTSTPQQSTENLVSVPTEKSISPVQTTTQTKPPSPYTRRLEPIQPDEPEQPVSPMEPGEGMRQDDDRASTISFESADSHLMQTGSDESSRPASSQADTLTQLEGRPHPRAKDLQKLEQRRALLKTRFTESRARLAEEVSAQTARQEMALQKAAEKRDRELQRQREKFEKGLKKIDEKQTREKRRMEEKERRIADKDDKLRLTRERNEARLELELLRKETGLIKIAMDDMQRDHAKAMGDMQRDHTKNVNDVQRENGRILENTRRDHAKLLEDTRLNHAKMMEETRSANAKMMEETRREHTRMMEDMRRNFTKQVDDLTKENTKLTGKLEKAVAKAKKKGSRESGSMSMLSLHRKNPSVEQNAFNAPDSPPASISS